MSPGTPRGATPPEPATSPPHPIESFSRALFALTELLDIPRAAVLAREKLDNLGLDETLSRADETLPGAGLAAGLAARLSAAQAAPGSGEETALAAFLRGSHPTGLAQVLHRLLTDLASHGGGGLRRLTFTLDGAQTEALAAGTGLAVGEVVAFVELLAHAGTLRLRLVVDKAELARHHGAPEGTRLFLCAEALVRELSCPLEEIEKGLFAGAGDGPLLVLVTGRDVALRGEHLALVGGRFLTAWRDHAPQQAAPPPAAAGVTPASAAAGPTALASAAATELRRPSPREMAEDAVGQVHWVDLHFSFLTPLHLALAPSDHGYAPEVCPIGRALYARRLDLCVAYAANQSRRAAREKAPTHRESGEWVASFGADEGFAQVRFGGDAEWQERALPADFAAGVATVTELVVWAYSGRRGDRDRLHVLQSVVARVLHGVDEDEAYGDLVRLAPEIARHREWFWATYWEGKLRDYLDSITRAGDLVDATKVRYEGELAALTKQLSDSTLAAVAVVLGSFVAAMFKTPFNTALFVTGVLLYTVYLVAFPAVLGMTQVYQRFDSARDDFRARRDAFKAQLYASSVDTILAPVAFAERRFLVWFVVTALAYAAVATLLVGGAVLVPLLLR